MRGAQSISTPSGVWRAAGLSRVGTGAVQRLRAAARNEVHARRGVAAGRSGPPRTRCWLATSAGCLKPRRFHGEGYRKAWAKLRVAGVRTATERVRRLMREHHLQAPYRAGHAHGPAAHDGTITTAAPDVMWGTDMTTTVTVGEGATCVFVAVDHCTTECIGLHAAKSGNRFEALEPIRQDVRERFGRSAPAPPAGCVCGTTTGPTTWLTTSNRRSPSSASKAPRASCGSPKATASRSASSAR